MSEIKTMIDDLGHAFEAFKAENDNRLKAIEAKGYAPADVVEKVEKINADISQISAMKKQLEALDTMVARGVVPGGGKSELDKIKGEHKAAFDKWFRKGHDEQALKSLEVKASLSTLSDPDGGFLVPEEVDRTIGQLAQTVSAMRRISSVMTIGTDTYKKLTSQGGATSGWVGEKASRAETTAPSLAEIAINTKEIYAMPYATQTLLDDAYVSIESWLAQEVAKEFAQEEAESFITGDGVSEPKGIAAYTMIANTSYAWGKVGFITSGHATLLNNADKLIDLQHSLKSIYRNGAAFLMADGTLATIRKLKDGDGNYMWRPGLEAGASDTLLGKPVEIDDNVAAIGASSYSVFFGNFKSAYLIVDRIGTRVLRDPFTAKPYIAFYTTKRVGGGIINYEALKSLKISA